jgi:hypothetical protein
MREYVERPEYDLLASWVNNDQRGATAMTG